MPTIKEQNEIEKAYEQLIEEFSTYVEESLTEINKHLEKASKHLDEATKLSNKYGIPFTSEVSPVSNNYSPRKINEKFKDLNTEIINDICGVYVDNDYPGWEHSAVC